MAKLTKRMKAIAAKIDREKSYSVDDAVNLLNEVATTSSKESIDVAINLGVDPRSRIRRCEAQRRCRTAPEGHARRGVCARRECGQAKAAGADLVGFGRSCGADQRWRTEFRRRDRNAGCDAHVGQLGRCSARAGDAEPEDRNGDARCRNRSAEREIGPRFSSRRQGRIVHGSVGKVGFGSDQGKPGIVDGFEKGQAGFGEGRVSEEDHAVDHDGTRRGYRSGLFGGLNSFEGAVTS